jgi:hypothetical protein
MATKAPGEVTRLRKHDHDVKDIPVSSMAETDTNKAVDAEALEVFQRNVDGVEFRTVSWQRATVVFLKINFAMSILTTPNALATFGAVGGGLSLVAWIVLNTCTLYLPRYRKSPEPLLTTSIQTPLFSWVSFATIIQNATVSSSSYLDRFATDLS